MNYICILQHCHETNLSMTQMVRILPFDLNFIQSCVNISRCSFKKLQNGDQIGQHLVEMNKSLVVN